MRKQTSQDIRLFSLQQEVTRFKHRFRVIVIIFFGLPLSCFSSPGIQGNVLLSELWLAQTGFIQSGWVPFLLLLLLILAAIITLRNIRLKASFNKVSIENQELRDRLKITQQDIQKTKESSWREQTEFLSRMSHDLRTPLNTILGFNDILSDLIDESQQQKYLSAIRSATKNLLTLINDIQDLSRMESGKLKLTYEPVNPRMILNEIENIFAEQAREKQLSFELNIKPELPEVLLLDEIRFRQIIFNLISNAIKYTDKGFVKILVKGDIKQQQAAEAMMDLELEVRDSGPGILPENKEAIFRAYNHRESHTYKKTSGAGMGLYISRTLARLMNGDIKLLSQPGKGTVFTLTLKDVKMMNSTTLKTGSKELTLKDVNFEKDKVLIVDDIGHNRTLIKEFLKNTNLITYEARNGQEAIEMAEQLQPNVILMDIRMPVVDGFEATRMIRNNDKCSKTSIIALTASIMEEEINKISESGFDEFLKKPVKLNKLIQVLIKFIPHQLINNKTTEKQPFDKDKNFHSIKKEQAEKLCSLLNGTLIKQWKIAKDSGFIDEISKFGQELLRVGHQFKAEYMISYAKELIESSDSFDVSRMKKNLNQYQELIEQVQQSTNEITKV